MRKTLTALLLVLVILCCASAACTEGEAKKGQTAISMTFSGTGNTPPAVSAGDELLLTIRIENTSGEDFAGEMYLFDPAHKSVPDFPKVLLKAGEAVEWSGKWAVTEEQIRTQKLTYAIQFRFLDENGESTSITRHFSKKLTLKMETPAKQVPEDRPQVFLYSVTRPGTEDGTAAAACMAESVSWAARSQECAAFFPAVFMIKYS